MTEYIIKIYDKDNNVTEYKVTATEGWRAENKVIREHKGYILRVECYEA